MKSRCEDRKKTLQKSERPRKYVSICIYLELSHGESYVDETAPNMSCMLHVEQSDQGDAAPPRPHQLLVAFAPQELTRPSRSHGSSRGIQVKSVRSTRVDTCWHGIYNFLDNIKIICKYINIFIFISFSKRRVFKVSSDNSGLEICAARF